MVIGLATACIAAGVVSLEMWLFDFKGGYCSTAWWKAKRFCTCPDLKAPAITFGRTMSSSKSVVRSAVASTAFMRTWARNAGDDSTCSAWKQWDDLLAEDSGKVIRWLVEYGIYIAVIQSTSERSTSSTPCQTSSNYTTFALLRCSGTCRLPRR